MALVLLAVALIDALIWQRNLHTPLAYEALYIYHGRHTESGPYRIFSVYLAAKHFNTVPATHASNHLQHR